MLCEVVAPPFIPKRLGDRGKINRHDAVSLARLHQAGELTGVRFPDETHEAIRDLVRPRGAANDALKRSRQQLRAFPLRRGHIYSGRSSISPVRTGVNGEHSTILPLAQLASGDAVERLRHVLGLS